MGISFCTMFSFVITIVPSFSPLARRFVSGSSVCIGYFPVGSLKPSWVFAPSNGMPPIEPNITGCCASAPSRKNPMTCEPLRSPVGELPIPLMAASVNG